MKYLTLICLLFNASIWSMHGNKKTIMYMGSQAYLDGYVDGREFPVNTMSTIKKKFSLIKNKEELDQEINKLAGSPDPFKRKFANTVKKALLIANSNDR